MSTISSQATKIIDALKDAFSIAWDQTEFELDCCIRAEIPIDPIHLNQWLTSQPHARKWASHTPQGNRAAVEMADELLGDTPAELTATLHLIKTRLNIYPENTRYIGGIGFSPTSVSPQLAEETPYFHFIIPKFEVTEKNQSYTFAVTLIPDLLKTKEEHWAKLEKECARLVWEPVPTPHLKASVRAILPNKNDWTIIIEKTKKAIQENKFQKAVLARNLQLTPEEPFSISSLYTHLLDTTPLHPSQEYAFLFQWQHTHAFLSRSPETLFHKTGNILSTEAIAGTERRGTTPEEDATLATQLLQSTKNLEEHTFVKAHIQTQLAPFCTQLILPETPNLLTLPTLHHLHTPIQVKLKPDITDGALIQALHPTPAVCGTPTQSAQTWIEQNEHFKREWYAGLVGWITKNETHFSVAIRSAFYVNNTLHTYAGAGITRNSDPLQEWEELDTKTQHWLSLIPQK